MEGTNREVGFTVRDITTRVENLTCWEVGCDETAILDEAKEEGYTYFPVLEDGLIAGVMRVDALVEGNRDYEPLTSRWLIAADTPILHLIELFAKEPDHHFFVLSSSQIIGLVSPADLNKVPARASFYLLVAHFEIQLTRFIRKFVGAKEADLSKYLSDRRIQEAKNTRDKEQSGDIDLPLLHYVQLFDLVTIVAKNEKLREMLKFGSRKSVEDTIKFLDVRNPVAHLNNLLIASTADLARVNDDCTQMIKYSTMIAEALQVGDAASPSIKA